jgi:hypothetical protein
MTYRFSSSRVGAIPVRNSFDHLVGAREHRRRDFETKRLRGLEIDHQLVLGRRLHKQVGRLLALEDAIDVASRKPVLVAFLGLNARVASLVRYEKTQPESGTAGCLSESRAPRYPTG